MVTDKKPIGDNQNVQTKPASGKVKLIGETLGNFRIVEEIGKGGMGVVYKAYDRALDRVIALKVLPAHLSDDEFIKRFIREARIAAKLEHPNIVQIYTVNRAGETWYIAMQFIKGKGLSDYLKEKYRFSVRDSLTIIGAVAEALAVAHRLGIIHRDIKPSNIMLDEDGKVKVMDFGLARAMVGRNKITQTGLYLGTPEYSSPEQCESSVVDERADIYSLGVVLYELLSGRVPHIAETPLALFKKIVEETPIPLKQLNPNLPKSVITVVEKMMAKDKEKRFRNVEELVTAIDRILQNESLPEIDSAVPLKLAEPVKARQTPVTPVKAMGRRPFVHRKQTVPLTYILGGLVVGLLIILAILLNQGSQQPVNERESSKGPNETSTSDRIVAPEPKTPIIAPVPKPAEKVITMVFDFQNTTNHPDRWLEIAIPDLVIGNLSQCEVLRVLPRTDLLKKMLDMGQKVNIAYSADQRLNLDTVSSQFLKHFEAEIIITGSFIINEPSKITVMADIYRYFGDKGEFKYITRCKKDGKDYNNDLFELVDGLSKEIVGVLKKNGTNYQIARASEIVFLEDPDTQNLLLAQLDEANKLVNLEMVAETQRGMGNFIQPAADARNLKAASPSAPAEWSAEKNDKGEMKDKKQTSEERVESKDYEGMLDALQKTNNGFLAFGQAGGTKTLTDKSAESVPPLKQGQGEPEQTTSGSIRNLKEERHEEELSDGKMSEKEKSINRNLLINRLKKLYQEIQRIEETDFQKKGRR